MIWRARQFAFTFPRPTLLMGIVNVTPDSFSDGGQFLAPHAAVKHALDLLAEGADILDIGGESTRPKATPVSETEELRRVIPVLEALATQVSVPLSIDTLKPAVARAALQAGASIINDVRANRNRNDPLEGDDDGNGIGMWALAAETGAGYIAMHMQGTPQTMQHNPTYADVVTEVGAFFEERLGRLGEAGVRPEQVALDPGLGFGKTPEHNFKLLAALKRFTTWKRPLVLGASRKSFLRPAMGGPEAVSRLPGSLACACWGVANGIQIVRTHEVAATRQALQVTEAIMDQSDSDSCPTGSH